MCFLHIPVVVLSSNLEAVKNMDFAVRLWSNTGLPNFFDLEHVKNCPVSSFENGYNTGFTGQLKKLKRAAHMLCVAERAPICSLAWSHLVRPWIVEATMIYEGVFWGEDKDGCERSGGRYICSSHLCLTQESSGQNGQSFFYLPNMSYGLGGRGSSL